MQFDPYTTFIIHVPNPPIAVYDEVWLHELVPQHAYFENFKLSLDESTLFEPISNNPQDASDANFNFLSLDESSSFEPINTHTYCNTILHHLGSTPHVPTTFNPHPQLSNNCTEINKHRKTSSKHKIGKKNSKHDPFINLEKELLTQFFTTLNNRQRGRVKKTYQVEFTEHIFSKLYNGKVNNDQGCKVKNKLIPIVRKHDT